MGTGYENVPKLGCGNGCIILDIFFKSLNFTLNTRVLWFVNYTLIGGGAGDLRSCGGGGRDPYLIHTKSLQIQGILHSRCTEAACCGGGGEVGRALGEDAITSQLWHHYLMHCGDPSSPSPKTFLSRWRQLAEKQRKAPLHSPPRNSSPESGSRSAIFVMGKACWKGSDQNHLCCGQARAMEGNRSHFDWGH